MNQITVDQLLAKIGLLVIENDLLKTELNKLQPAPEKSEEYIEK